MNRSNDVPASAALGTARRQLAGAVVRLEERLRSWHFAALRSFLGRPALGVLLTWFVFLGLAVVMLLARGVVTKLYTHDLFFVFDGSWRIFQGQQPFRDFHSPIGYAFFLPFAALRHVEPYSLSVLMHANLLVASVLLVLATLALRRRLSPPLFFLAVIGLTMVVVTPRATDRGFQIYSFLAPYNRWCEAAMMLVCLVALTPIGRGAGSTEAEAGAKSAARRLDGVGSAVIALGLLFVFHVKLPYFLATGGVVLVAALGGRMAWRSVLLAAALVAAGDLLVELALGIHAAYFSDLRMAAIAAGADDVEQARFKSLDTGFASLIRFALASTALLLLANFRGDWQRWWSSNRRDLGIVTGALAFAFIANTQNHWQLEIPMMVSILLTVAEQARRGWLDGERREVRGLAAGLIVLLASKAIVFKDIVSVVHHTVESRGDTVCVLPAWRGTVGQQLLFPKVVLSADGLDLSRPCDDIRIDVGMIHRSLGPRAVDFSNEASVEAVRLSAARELLGPAVPPDTSIFAMAFTNPYPAFTSSRPPLGAQLWWDYGRNYSRLDRPDAATIFDSADIVLVSRFDKPPEAHGGNMTRVYGPALVEEFRPVAQNAMWQRWERRVPRRPAPGASVPTR